MRPCPLLSSPASPQPSRPTRYRTGRALRRRPGGRLHRRRGDRDRQRWPGAGHPETLTLRDRLLLTLTWLRLALPHQALGLLYGVDRSTVSAAIRQIRPLLANRGFATPTGQRLHTLADILAYAAAEGVTIRLDGTEIQVRRFQANQPGRRAFVSGKKNRTPSKPSSPPTPTAGHSGPAPSAPAANLGPVLPGVAKLRVQALAERGDRIVGTGTGDGAADRVAGVDPRKVIQPDGGHGAVNESENALECTGPTIGATRIQPRIRQRSRRRGDAADDGQQRW